MNLGSVHGLVYGLVHCLVYGTWFMVSLTLFDRMVFHVVEDRDDPIGTGNFVLLLTKVCRLGAHFMYLVTKVCQLAPRQGRAGRAPSPTACEPTGTSWTLATFRLGGTWHTLVTNNPKDLCVTHSVNTHNFGIPH